MPDMLDPNFEEVLKVLVQKCEKSLRTKEGDSIDEEACAAAVNALSNTLRVTMGDVLEAAIVKHDRRAERIMSKRLSQIERLIKRRRAP
jgi:hypothetical protein